ncbi:uncharacterized protein LOC111708430 [Eurytemora carolleeae]|uniref:uncharacterized protein LOC111708430 n=1 Tax=Eurytemora carolleeae TaxID=1294199 RepID=UPI000C77FC1B|nr:uncharacterized protein LOC111708430 [Eurytemora carolleeae]|eukprot:XP_023337576.1 uncharacterized protein LOC111708430 [Eurytemora affinis]
MRFLLFWVQVLLVVCLTVADECYWENVLNSWSSGKRSLISIPVPENMDSWNITLEFDGTDLELQAWKGDVSQISDNTFSITNNCYNGRLYACQCLEISYLVRHKYGVELGFNLTFNSVLFSTCDQSPDCSGKGEATEAAATTEDIATTKAASASETHSTAAASETQSPEAASETQSPEAVSETQSPEAASETQSTVAASKTSATDAASVSEPVISEITTEISFTTATDESPCLTSFPCHPEAVCAPSDTSSYSCSCPDGFNSTGVDLFNSSSTLTACFSSSNQSTVLGDGLTNLTDPSSLFDATFLNTSAIDALSDILAEDPGTSTTEEFVAGLINNETTLQLLVSAVGSDQTAIETVISGLGNNTKEVQTFIQALSVAGIVYPPLTTLSSRKNRLKRDTAKQLKTYIRQFFKFVKELRNILKNNMTCSILDALKKLLSSDPSCSQLQSILSSVFSSLEYKRVVNILRTVLYLLNRILSNPFQQIMQAGFFPFFRGYSLLFNLQPCIQNLELIQYAETSLCSGELCCLSPSTCSTSSGVASCICSSGVEYQEQTGCSQTTMITSSSTQPQPISSQPQMNPNLHPLNLNLLQLYLNFYQLNLNLPPLNPNLPPLNLNLPHLNLNLLPPNLNFLPLNPNLPPLNPNLSPLNLILPSLNLNYLQLNPNLPPLNPNLLPPIPNLPPLNLNLLPLNPNLSPLNPNLLPPILNLPPLNLNFLQLTPNLPPLNQNLPPLNPNLHPLIPNLSSLNVSLPPLNLNLPPLNLNLLPLNPNLPLLKPNLRPLNLSLNLLILLLPKTPTLQQQ